MCEPVLVGTAATTTLAGSAGTGMVLTSAGVSAAGVASMATTTTAATSGIFGSAGVFSFSQTASMLGTIGSFANSLYSGKQQSNQLEYQAQMLEYNRKVGENNAMSAEYAAEYEADIYDENVRRVLGTQDTRYANAGVVINTDSPLDVKIADVENATAERLAILYGGEVKGYAARTGAEAQGFAAENYRRQAGSAKTASYINAGVDLGKGGYSHYRKYGSLLGT
tara:strand:+ start:14899 stop:15570 length:672 start_codon:yes stop_codon:yes gene_type:complete